MEFIKSIKPLKYLAFAMIFKYLLMMCYFISLVLLIMEKIIAAGLVGLIALVFALGIVFCDGLFVFGILRGDKNHKKKTNK